MKLNAFWRTSERLTGRITELGPNGKSAPWGVCIRKPNIKKGKTVEYSTLYTCRYKGRALILRCTETHADQLARKRKEPLYTCHPTLLRTTPRIGHTHPGIQHPPPNDTGQAEHQPILTAVDHPGAFLALRTPSHVPRPGSRAINHVVLR